MIELHDVPHWYADASFAALHCWVQVPDSPQSARAGTPAKATTPQATTQTAKLRQIINLLAYISFSFSLLLIFKQRQNDMPFAFWSPTTNAHCEEKLVPLCITIAARSDHY